MREMSEKQALGNPLILQLSSTQVSNPLSSISSLLTPGNNSSYITSLLRKELAVENVVMQQFEPLEAAVGQIRGGFPNISSKFHGNS